MAKMYIISSSSHHDMLSDSFKNQKREVPAGIYLFKVSNRIRTRWETCSKSTIKIVNFEHIFTPCSSVSIINFEQASACWDFTFLILYGITWNIMVTWNTNYVHFSHILHYTFWFYRMKHPNFTSIVFYLGKQIRLSRGKMNYIKDS